MTENMKKFLEAVSKNEELTKKINTMTKEDLLALDKELGVELTEADFEKPDDKLDENELEAVAGGWTECFCAAGGGGKKDEDGKACGCVLMGYGKTRDGEERCYCPVTGFGYHPDCMKSGELPWYEQYK